MSEEKDSKAESDSIPDSGIEQLPELNELFEAAESLPEEMRASYQRAVYSVVAKITKASFASPIPPPEYMEAYERISKGSFNRILQMVEKQQEHRLRLESVVVFGNSQRENIGQWMAYSLAGIAVLFGFHFVNTGKDVQGFAILLGAIAGLVAMFNSAKNKQLTELRERFKRLTEKPNDRELLPKPLKPD